MSVAVELDSTATENGFAQMLGTLLIQNLESKPRKRKIASKMRGRVAIVADDAGVSVTLVFEGATIRVFGGIVGYPDVTVRGETDAILATSSIPLHTWLSLPFPDPRRSEEKANFATFIEGQRTGAVHTHGFFTHPRLSIGLMQVLSIYGE